MKARSLLLGIDPGVTGAFALYDPATTKLIDTFAMPTTASGKTRAHAGNKSKKIDASGVGELVNKIAPFCMHATIELVGARPAQGSVSTFTFGFATGIVHGALGCYQIPLHSVRPDIWKLLLGVTKDKNTSLALATKLFPEHAWRWPNPNQSGHAEAAILAHFGARFINETPHDREDGQQLSEFARDLLK